MQSAAIARADCRYLSPAQKFSLQSCNLSLDSGHLLVGESALRWTIIVGTKAAPASLHGWVSRSEWNGGATAQ